MKVVEELELKQKEMDEAEERTIKSICFTQTKEMEGNEGMELEKKEVDEQAKRIEQLTFLGARRDENRRIKEGSNT